MIHSIAGVQGQGKGVEARSAMRRRDDNEGAALDVLELKQYSSLEDESLVNQFQQGLGPRDKI